MSHLDVRVYTVLKEQRPYEVRDLEGHPHSRLEAGRFIQEQFRVPVEVRRLWRHHKRATGAPYPNQTGLAVETMDIRLTDRTSREGSYTR